MTTWDVRANRLLAAQEHVIAAAQVLRCGGTRSGIQAKVGQGVWAAVAPGVYRPVGMEGGWEQQLWVAHLAAGPASVVAHDSAAQLHGLPPVVRDAVMLTVPLGAHPRVRGAVVREMADLAPHHVGRWKGLPVTTPARTLVDLAGRREVSPTRLDDLVTVAHRARLASVGDVAAVTGDVRRKGKRGMAKLDTVLERRAPGAPIPTSVLEEALHELVGLAGLGHHVAYQFPLPGDRPSLGCVDAAFPAAQLIVEADGRRWHSQEADLERDRERDTRAATQGWQTVRLTYRRLTRDLAGAASDLRTIFLRRVRPPIRASA